MSCGRNFADAGKVMIFFSSSEINLTSRYITEVVAQRSGDHRIHNLMRPSERLLIYAKWSPEAHEFDTPGLDDADKFSKIRPLVKHLNKRFLEHAPVSEEFYSFDKSICEYYRRHACKQFLRVISIRFGFKIWCGTTTLGYLV